MDQQIFFKFFEGLNVWKYIYLLSDREFIYYIYLNYVFKNSSNAFCNVFKIKFVYIFIFRCESPVNRFVMSKSPSVEEMAVKEKHKDVSIKESTTFIFDDSAYRESIFEKLYKLRKNKQFCDVILQVNKLLQSFYLFVILFTIIYFRKLY